MKKKILFVALLVFHSSIFAGDESFDVLGSVMDTTKKEINAKQTVDNGKKDFLNSKYTKLNKEGYWQFFQASSKAKKGEYCTAVFTKEGVGVSILGPGGDYRGALMMFFSAHENPAFPVSKTTAKIPVTLKQGSDAPVTIKALNYMIGTSWPTPVVVFAVPTIEAAIEGMDDKLDFHLQYDGQNIVDVEWHGGLAAKEELKKCLAGKPFNDKNPLKDKSIK